MCHHHQSTEEWDEVVRKLVEEDEFRTEEETAEEKENPVPADD